MKKSLWMGSLLVLQSAILAAALCAAQPEPQPLTSKPVSVSLFKNGIGFFERQAEVSLTDGWAIMRDLPEATLGSFWVAPAAPDTIVEELIASREHSAQQLHAITLEEFLKANVGKRIECLAHGEKISGTLLSVPEDRSPESLPEFTSYYRSRPPPPKSQLAQLVTLRTRDGIVALRKDAIQMLTIRGDTSDVFTRTELQNVLKLHVRSSDPPARITLSYLQGGISWVPSYAVQLLDDTKAKITMKAVVINDVEDLEDVDVYFVTGFPHFLFSGITFPLSPAQSLDFFIRSLLEERERRFGRAGGRALVTQQVLYNISSLEGLGPSPGVSPQDLAGTFQEDLFYYARKHLSLKKGERGYYTVFSETVPYSHLYEWDIPDTLKREPTSSRSQDEIPKEMEAVWHSIKLKNTTQFPWTTAAAITLQQNYPLGQDMISYTSVGAESNLKITLATDVKARKKEYEINRIRKEASIFGGYYDLVTVKGELKVTNYKSKDVTLKITKHLSGEVLDTSPNGTVNIVAEGLKAVNPNCVITWELQLKPKEEQEISYTYQVYIRR